MTNILAFKALRPQADYVKEVVSPPYDIISREEARLYTKDKAHSFLRIIRSDLEFDDSISPYDEIIYEKAKKNLNNFIKDDILFFEKEECFYLYRLNYKDHEQIALVALSSIKEYQKNQIKKHELTRADKEVDRTKHISHLKANTGPVFLMYEHKKNTNIFDLLQSCINEKTLLYDCLVQDQNRHRIYKIADPEKQKALIQAFAKIPCTYIADGHHRAASAAKSNTESNQTHFLSVLFPDHQLKIYPYNRVVFLDPHSSQDESQLLENIQKKFDVSCIKSLSNEDLKKTSDIALYSKGLWYLLHYKEEFLNQLKEEKEKIGAHILQKEILEPLLHIKNIREAENIKFIGGEDAHEKVEKFIQNSKKEAIGFALYPVNTQQIKEVANKNEIMPPKSTWFHPKIYSGFLSYVWGNYR